MLPDNTVPLTEHTPGADDIDSYTTDMDTTLTAETNVSELSTPTKALGPQRAVATTATRPADLVALSMSMMDDFEDVERGITPS